MLKTTIGQLSVNAGLPKELRNTGMVLDKKGLDALMQAAAELGPDEYREIAQHLLQVGKHVAQITGGNSFGPEHLRVSVSGRKAQYDLNRQVRAIYADRRLTDESKEKKVVDLLTEAGDTQTTETMRESLSEHNPIATQIASGARGNPTNLRSLRGAGDLLYVDHRNRPIPIPILNNYSQGLSPAEFYAGTFGARRGVLSAKFATRDTGYYSKQLRQASHRLIVAAEDADESGDHKDRPRGLPTSIDDPYNEGALLAMDTGDFKRNTILTPKVIAELREGGFERLLVRSPIVGGHPNGGLYARDLGIREKGTLPPVGDFIGISSADALSEPVIQSALGEKHKGGIASGGRPMGPSGFELFDQYLQVPKTFKGGAAHAQEDGRVAAIWPAPQGGTYVQVGSKNHYIGRGYDPIVKIGQEVEAGDILSDGLPNPAEIVAHKGIGEGRRYFVEQFVRAYKDSGVPVHRRNVEALARSLINHVELTDEMNDHVLGDVLPYSSIEHIYEPREDHSVVPVSSAKGKYLEQPVLHYSIGTKVRPLVLKTLNEFGVKNVAVHHNPPAFQARMIRGMENLTHDEDWMTRFLGSYLKKNLLSGVHRGDVSDERGTSFVPSLARAVNFGQQAPVKGWVATGAAPKAPTPSPSIMKQMQEPEEDLSKATLVQKAAARMLIKQAEEDIFQNLHPDLDAGHEVEFMEGDDDEEYPTQSIIYPIPQHKLTTHKDEAGDDLAVFQGSNPAGKSGSFEIIRPGLLRRRTKFYRHCTEDEQDQLLREFAPIMTAMPKLHASASELIEDLKNHRKEIT